MNTMDHLKAAEIVRRKKKKMIDLTHAMTPEEIEATTSVEWTPKTMGRKGGLRTSPAKTRACSRNGKKGGWTKGKPRPKPIELYVAKTIDKILDVVECYGPHKYWVVAHLKTSGTEIVEQRFLMYTEKEAIKWIKRMKTIMEGIEK